MLQISDGCTKQDPNSGRRLPYRFFIYHYILINYKDICIYIYIRTLHIYILYISRGWAKFPIAGNIHTFFSPDDEAVVDNKCHFQ